MPSGISLRGGGLSGCRLLRFIVSGGHRPLRFRLPQFLSPAGCLYAASGQCLSPAGCLSALGPSALALPPLRGGPLPLQARVLMAPKQSRRLQTQCPPAHGSGLRPPPVCKTALPAHGPGLRPPPVCKTAPPAHGPCLRSPPVCKTAPPAHGPGLRPPPVCKTPLSAHSSGLRPPPVCKTALPAHGPGLRPPPVCKTALPAHGSGLLASLAATEGGLKGENDYLCGV